MPADPSPSVVATESAVTEIGRLRGEYGPLMFFQSGGCCDGSSPMCFPDGELFVGPSDLLLGEVEGCPFYIDRDHYERCNRPTLLLDIAAGAGSGMSLEGIHDRHFVTSSPPGALRAGPGPHGTYGLRMIWTASATSNPAALVRREI